VRIRTVPTSSGKHAIQVVSKKDGAYLIHRHIGTFASEAERSLLVSQATAFIKQYSNQPSLFTDTPQMWQLSEVEVIRSQPLFLYHLLSTAYDKLGLQAVGDSLIKDLVIARIYAPASKRETQEILTDLFNRPYSLKTIYRHLKVAMSTGLQENIQKALLAYAKEGLHDQLHLVFYDVTTLAFASQAQTELKEFGFSKDHRSQDTQVVVGLVVNTDGFPLYFDIFAGNTFEGSTFLAVVKKVRALLAVPDLVVVADAGMLSQKNMDALDQSGIKFVVGARIANLPISVLRSLATTLAGTDHSVTETAHKGYRLIVDYSTKRATKDRHNLDRQREKALLALQSPSTITRRYRFLKVSDKKNYALNEELFEKAKLVEGMKGYLTNTKLDHPLIIERYHDLWKVEKAFRITKSDLEARPIFHRLDGVIKAHSTIVFAGLAISRLLELQTGMSIHAILKLTDKIFTHTIRHSKTHEITTLETTITDPIVCGKLAQLKALGY
jgi:transposase